MIWKGTPKIIIKIKTTSKSKRELIQATITRVIGKISVGIYVVLIKFEFNTMESNAPVVPELKSLNIMNPIKKKTAKFSIPDEKTEVKIKTKMLIRISGSNKYHKKPKKDSLYRLLRSRLINSRIRSLYSHIFNFNWMITGYVYGYV